MKRILDRILDKLKKEINSSKGFTLTEMLVTVLIMSLVMVIVANGMTTVKEVYDKTIAKSDAQMLLSTAEEELRNELQFVSKVKIDTDGNVEYYFDPFSDGLKVSLKVDDVIIKKYYGDITEGIPLVTSNDPGIEYLKVSYDSITYNGNVFTVSGLKVTRGDNINLAGDKDGNPINLVIKPVNKVELI